MLLIWLICNTISPSTVLIIIIGTNQNSFANHSILYRVSLDLKPVQEDLIPVVILGQKCHTNGSYLQNYGAVNVYNKLNKVERKKYIIYLFISSSMWPPSAWIHFLNHLDWKCLTIWSNEVYLMCLASLKVTVHTSRCSCIPIHANLTESHPLTIVANSAQHRVQEIADSGIAWQSDWNGWTVHHLISRSQWNLFEKGLLAVYAAII